MTEKKPEALSVLMTLADLLGVDLNDSRTAIATPQHSATARMYDGSLEAKVIPTVYGIVDVSSPRGPTIQIKLVDQNKDRLAPAGAIYEITSYCPGAAMLNGEVFCVYVGKDGIILDDSALRRAAELYNKKESKRKGEIPF